MKYQYVVILRKSGEKPIDLLSVLLCFGSAVIFMLIPFFTDLTNYYYYVLAAVLPERLSTMRSLRAARQSRLSTDICSLSRRSAGLPYMGYAGSALSLGYWLFWNSRPNAHWRSDSTATASSSTP